MELFHFDFVDRFGVRSSAEIGRDFPTEMHSSLRSEAMRNLALTARRDMSIFFLFSSEAFDVS